MKTSDRGTNKALKPKERSNSLGSAGLELNRQKDRMSVAHGQTWAPAGGSDEKQKNAEHGRPPVKISGKVLLNRVTVRKKLDKDLSPQLRYQSVSVASEKPHGTCRVQDDNLGLSDKPVPEENMTRDEGSTFLTGDGMTLETFSSDLDPEFTVSACSNKFKELSPVASASSSDHGSVSSLDGYGIRTVLDMGSIQTAVTMVTDTGGARTPESRGRFSDTSEVPLPYV